MINRFLNFTVLALLLLIAGIAHAKPGDRTTSAIIDFGGAAQPGHTTLVRTPNGLSATWAGSGVGVESGFVYTLWFIVFNEPEDCVTPAPGGGFMCGETDVFIDPESAMVDILFSGGSIAGNNEWIRLGGHRKRGDNSGSVYSFLGVEDPPGLIDPMGAEVHLVLRSHGPVIPGMVADQIGSFEGGCVVFQNPPEIPDEEGECADIKASIHLP